MDLTLFSIPDYHCDALDRRIQELLEFDLNLTDNGEMMMPLKAHEIGALWSSIRRLVDDERGDR
jgi:hypothetical protein